MLSIEFSKDEVYEYVSLNTGAIGKANDDYDKYCCTPDNYPALDMMMDAAVGNILYMGSTHMSGLRYDKSNGNICFVAHDVTMSEERKITLKANLILAISYSLSAMWIGNFDTEAASTMSTLVNDFVSACIKMLSQRGLIGDDGYQLQSNDNVSIETNSPMSERMIQLEDDVLEKCDHPFPSHETELINI